HSGTFLGNAAAELVQFLLTPVEYGGEITGEMQTVKYRDTTNYSDFQPLACFRHHYIEVKRRDATQWLLLTLRFRTRLSIFLTILTFRRIFSFIFGFSRWRSFALELGYPVTRLWNWCAYCLGSVHGVLT